MENKTHYRKVFKSDHVGVADLEDFIEEKKGLIFTISHVKQEINIAVAGKKGNFNIAYFVEKIKPLVLNATNSRALRMMTNSVFVEDWKNLKIELFIEKNIRFGRDIVDGVRIKTLAKTFISDENARSILSESKTLFDLKNNWEKLTKEERNLPTILALKETLKTTLK